MTTRCRPAAAPQGIGGSQGLILLAVLIGAVAVATLGVAGNTGDTLQVRRAVRGAYAARAARLGDGLGDVVAGLLPAAAGTPGRGLLARLLAAAASTCLSACCLTRTPQSVAGQSAQDSLSSIAGRLAEGL